MKKNLFIAAMGLLVMAGCSSNGDEIDNIIANNENAITFDSYVGKTTKAGVTEAFGVFAYQGTWASTLTANFMFNQKVETSGSYTPIKYWSGTNVSFIAYSPYQASETGKALKDYTNTTQGLPQMDFTLPTTANTDLLVSDLVKNIKAGSVSLLLKHALARITFSIEDPKIEADGENNPTTVTLTSVVLSGLKSSGVLTFGELDRTWNTDDAAVINDFEVTAKAPYYMIPQELAGVKANITYTIKTTDAALPSGGLSIEKTVEIDLATTNISTWDITKQYNYTVSPTLEKVSIKATVDAWGEEKAPAIPEKTEP